MGRNPLYSFYNIYNFYNIYSFYKIYSFYIINHLTAMGEKSHNFWVRTATSAVYIIVMMGSIYSGRLLGSHNWGIAILTALALFVSVGCAFEYYRIAGCHGAHPNRPLGYFFTAVMTLGLALAGLGKPLFGITEDIPICTFAFGEIGTPILFAALLVLFLALPITLMVELWRHSEHPFGDVLHTLLPVLYCALPLGLMPFLHNTLNILVPCIWFVWVNDACAYMGGSLVGRHKMWPRHSPGKSWEGTAIGVVCCMVVAAIMGPMFQTAMSRVDWIILGLICSVIGTLGDLCESMLKRAAGVKDSGKLLPGHGGLLDRFDSLLMILPVIALYDILASLM